MLSLRILAAVRNTIAEMQTESPDGIQDLISGEEIRGMARPSSPAKRRPSPPVEFLGRSRPQFPGASRDFPCSRFHWSLYERGGAVGLQPGHGDGAYQSSGEPVGSHSFRAVPVFQGYRSDRIGPSGAGICRAALGARRGSENGPQGSAIKPQRCPYCFQITPTPRHPESSDRTRRGLHGTCTVRFIFGP